MDRSCTVDLAVGDAEFKDCRALRAEELLVSFPHNFLSKPWDRVEDSVREYECRDVCNDIETCEKQTSSTLDGDVSYLTSTLCPAATFVR